jgi:hypothetical protein
LYSGDCRAILPALGGRGAWRGAFVIADVPYGIALQNHDPGGTRSDRAYEIAGDACNGVAEWIIDWADAEALPLCVFASPWNPWPGEWRNRIVWDKGGAVGGGGDTRTCLKRSWELIQVRRNGPLLDGRGESVWDYPVTPAEYVHHIAAKPVTLIHRILRTFAPPGTLIVDPCCGSGPTLLAAAEAGYPAIGIELDENHCASATRRLAQQAREGGYLYA